MERKKKSILVAFGLSLALFVTLIGLTIDTRYRYDSHDPYAEVFGLNVNLRWILKGNQADYVAVQDTLNYYAMALNTAQVTSRADWQLDHCCGDKAFQGDYANGGDMYHLEAAMNFGALPDRKNLVEMCIAKGWVDFERCDYRYGLASGRMNLHLPMPNQDGKVLHIEDSQFEVTFFANDWVQGHS